MSNENHQSNPKYLERFSEICAQLGPHHLSQEQNNLFNRATWELAIFTYNVQRSKFKRAGLHLNKVSHFLNAIPKGVKAKEEMSDADVIINKLRRFTQNLQKQYKKFLDKKI